MGILERAIASSSASAMLLSIPAELVVKLIPSCTIPEVFVASYVFGEGNEVQLEYKEKEIEKGVLMLNER